MHKKASLFSLLMTVSIVVACSTESPPPSGDGSSGTTTTASGGSKQTATKQVPPDTLQTIKTEWKAVAKDESATVIFERIITTWKTHGGPLARKLRAHREALANAIQEAVQAAEVDNWQEVPTHLSRDNVKKLKGKSADARNIKSGERGDNHKISPEDKAKLDQYLALLDRYLDLAGVQN
ncbi:MAG: hypothetical protein ROO73_04960 [Roseivirga sp.]